MKWITVTNCTNILVQKFFVFSQPCKDWASFQGRESGLKTTADCRWQQTFYAKCPSDDQINTVYFWKPINQIEGIQRHSSVNQNVNYARQMGQQLYVVWPCNVIWVISKTGYGKQWLFILVNPHTYFWLVCVICV